MTQAVIEAVGLHKSFGETHALAGLDFDVAEGKILGMLGPNGAGKTTAVRILTTLTRPDKGSATVAGIDVLRHPDRVRAKIGVAGQYAALDELLTGRENLRMIGRLYRLDGPTAKSRADALLERFELTDAVDRTVKTYSGGMRRRLDLGGVRDLTLGTNLYAAELPSVLWSVGTLAIGFPLGLWLYNRRTTQ